MSDERETKIIMTGNIDGVSVTVSGLSVAECEEKMKRLQAMAAHSLALEDQPKPQPLPKTRWERKADEVVTAAKQPDTLWLEGTPARLVMPVHGTIDELKRDLRKWLAALIQAADREGQERMQKRCATLIGEKYNYLGLADYIRAIEVE